MGFCKQQLNRVFSLIKLSPRRLFAIFCSVAFFSSLPFDVNAATYTVMTGSRTGIYYPAGIAMRTLLDLKQSNDTPVHFRILESTGAVENMHALLKGETDVAFADASTIVAVLTKQPPFDTYDDHIRLKALVPLWTDIGHFVLHKMDANTGRIEDFKDLLGATVSFGPKYSTSFQSAAHVFSRNGIYFDRLFTLSNLNHRRTVKAYRQGLIDGFVLFSNKGDPLIDLAMMDKKIETKLLSVSDARLEHLNKLEIPIWRRYVIPPNTYHNQNYEVRTIAQSNFLVVRSDFDSKGALHIAKTLMENISFLSALHPAMAQIKSIHEDGEKYLPYHPGVKDYYRRTVGCRSILCLFN